MALGRPRPHAQRTESTPRVRNQPSPHLATARTIARLEQRAAASHLDLFEPPTRVFWIALVALVFGAGTVPAMAQEAPRHGGELVFVVPAEPPSYDADRAETFAVVQHAA